MSLLRGSVRVCFRGHVKVYALVSSQARDAVELYVSAVDAQRDMDLVAADDPELARCLSVVELDFAALARDSARASTN